MTPEQQAAMANLDFSILEGTLDDIDDLPGFAVFPSGAYLVELHEGLQRKAIAGHPAVECAMKLLEVKELANAAADEANKPKLGDICTAAYMLDNTTGQGFLKDNLLKPIGAKLGLVKNSEIIAASKGIQALVVMTKTTKEKDGVTKEYCKIVRFVPL
jgi:hypothetical protein